MNRGDDSRDHAIRHFGVDYALTRPTGALLAKREANETGVDAGMSSAEED